MTPCTLKSIANLAKKANPMKQYGTLLSLGLYDAILVKGKSKMKPILAAVMVCVWVLAGLYGYAQQSEPGQSTGLKGPYLGQPVPGIVPTAFAPGIVSKEGAKVSACTFSPDGKEFYFTKGNEEIMASRLTEQGWTYPAPFSISAGHRALEPHVTLDNKRIYWNWDCPAHIGGIYVAERIADGWSAARYAGPGMFVSSSRDGNVYVTHLGTQSDYVSRAIMDGDCIVGYEDLKGGIEKMRRRSDSVAHPCIAPDGSYILFDIGGGPHLFVSFIRQDGTWGEPIDLSQHGFDIKAGIASISPDGKYLFFGQEGVLYWVSTQVVEELRPKGR
jgi:hypothetical protein